MAAVEQRPGVHAKVRDRIKNLFAGMAHRRNRSMSRDECAAWYDDHVNDDMLTAFAQKAGVELPAAGAKEGTFLDWLKTVDWAKVLQIVMQILSIFAMFAEPTPAEGFTFHIDESGMPAKKMTGAVGMDFAVSTGMSLAAIRAKVEAQGFTWDEVKIGLKKWLPVANMLAGLTPNNWDDAAVAGLEAFLAELG